MKTGKSNKAVAVSTFAGALRQYRQQRRYRLRELAEVLGKGVSYVAALEAGKCRPPEQNEVQRMAEVMKLSNEETADLMLLARIFNDVISIDIDRSNPYVETLITIAHDWYSMDLKVQDQFTQLLQAYKNGEPAKVVINEGATRRKRAQSNEQKSARTGGTARVRVKI